VLEKRYWTGTPIMEYRVKVFFADGSSMNGTVTNQSLDGGDPASAQAQPPMTVEELASLLTAPGVVVP